MKALTQDWAWCNRGRKKRLMWPAWNEWRAIGEDEPGRWMKARSWRLGTTSFWASFECTWLRDSWGLCECFKIHYSGLFPFILDPLGPPRGNTQCPVGPLIIRKAESVSYYEERRSVSAWNTRVHWKLPGSEDRKGNLLGFMVCVLWHQKIKVKDNWAVS